MRSSHTVDRVDTAFDDDRLVADAGLLLPAPWPSGSVSVNSSSGTSTSVMPPYQPCSSSAARLLSLVGARGLARPIPTSGSTSSGSCPIGH